MERAQMELARRRVNGDLTVADVVFGWRKFLVPAAVLAASVAGVFVLGHGEPADPLPPVALQEALIEDLDGETIPAVLAREGELEEVVFLTAAGGY
jgi:hypothetical protein